MSRIGRTLVFPQAPRGRFPIDFYRDELLKHQRCLQRQREYYSEVAITSAEAGVRRLMDRLDQVCRRKDADQVMCRLLRQLDVVTGLSAWSDAKKAN
ncbi:MAG TPA: hypothetical protein PKK95_13595 [Vicinamibacterales bacterium]|nr:hypothetical protein [Acidobacteriota bacterium]HOC19301.1 hypothetical protein [Vicinamibacterales bacterium]